MNQKYKLKFDELWENDPTQKEAGEERSKQSFPSVSHARNLCIVWEDGKRMFLNYAYLISGELQPEDSTIALLFTTHSVQIKGSNLENLYEEFTGHLIKQITCTDERYNATVGTDETVVNEITVIKNS
jgi:hypothetical protein